MVDKYLISLFQISKFNRKDRKFSIESILIDKSIPKDVPIIIEKIEIKKEFIKNIEQIWNWLIPSVFNKTISLNFSLIKKIWLEIMVNEEITTIKKLENQVTKSQGVIKDFKTEKSSEIASSVLLNHL